MPLIRSLGLFRYYLMPGSGLRDIVDVRVQKKGVFKRSLIARQDLATSRRKCMYLHAPRTREVSQATMHYLNLIIVSQLFAKHQKNSTSKLLPIDCRLYILSSSYPFQAYFLMLSPFRASQAAYQSQVSKESKPSLTIYAHQISLQTSEIRSLLSSSITNIAEDRGELRMAIKETRDILKGHDAANTNLNKVVKKLEGMGMAPRPCLPPIGLLESRRLTKISGF